MAIIQSFIPFSLGITCILIAIFIFIISYFIDDNNIYYYIPIGIFALVGLILFVMGIKKPTRIRSPASSTNKQSNITFSNIHTINSSLP